MDVGFGTIWEAVTDRLPDVAAIVEPGREFTRAQFDDRAARLASALRAGGVREGDTVACYLYNGAAYLETVFAAFKLGAVAVNANYRYTGRELGSLLADAGTTALVHSASLARNVTDAVPAVPSLRLTLGDDDIERVIAEHPPLPRGPRPGSDRLFMYTGGTTGMPKGVIWRHGDLLHSIAVATYGPLDRAMPETLAEAVEAALDAADRGLAPITLPVVPLMHGTGLFNTIGALLVGGTIVFAPPGRLNPARIWDTVATRRVSTLIVAGNAVCRPLVDDLVEADRAGTPRDLSSVRTVISSGTAMSDDVKYELHRRGELTIIDALASSEGGPFAFATTRGTDDLPSRFMPVPATKVFDSQDVEVVPGSPGIGTLAYCGPLPLGYHNDSVKSAATFRVIDGVRWSQPGDLVEMRPDGSIRFLGRGSGVINTGGEKVHPQEVEDALLTHSAVRDAVVVGKPDPTWGELVCAIVAVNPDAGVTEAGLIEHVRPDLAGYKVPRTILLVPEIPRTPTCKIEMAWARAAVAVA
jgi:acyl-CoA synthetase (AMP-forming)/AMP-acid ligase II